MRVNGSRDSFFIAFFASMGAIPSCGLLILSSPSETVDTRTLWGGAVREQVGLMASEFNSSGKGRTIGLYE